MACQEEDETCRHPTANTRSELAPSAGHGETASLVLRGASSSAARRPGSRRNPGWTCSWRACETQRAVPQCHCCAAAGVEGGFKRRIRALRSRCELPLLRRQGERARVGIWAGHAPGRHAQPSLRPCCAAARVEGGPERRIPRPMLQVVFRGRVSVPGHVLERVTAQTIPAVCAKQLLRRPLPENAKVVEKVVLTQHASFGGRRTGESSLSLELIAPS